MFSEQIQELFENADEPQLIDHLGNISPILSSIKDYRKVYEYVFETFLNNRYFIISYNGLYYLSAFSQAELTDLRKKLVEHLVLHMGKATSDIREFIKNEFDSSKTGFRCQSNW